MSTKQPAITPKDIDDREARELIVEAARQTERLEDFRVYRPGGQVGVHLVLSNEEANGVSRGLTETLDEHGWRIATTYQDKSRGQTHTDVIRK